LVGYRGAGKSTVARLLAERLGWEWMDTDEAIEARRGKAIREIFALEGEHVFRTAESELLAEICRLERHVVATGGGMALAECNRNLMRAAGRIVWLQADAATLWKRLQSDPTTAERRPPLAGGGLMEVNQVLQAREPLYRDCAHYSVSTADRTPMEAVEDVLAYLQERPLDAPCVHRSTSG
jgi:shikimate kinase